MIGPGTFNDSGVANPQWKFLGDLSINGILDMNSNRITNISMPVANSDVATKGYVDAAIGGGVCYTNYGYSTCHPGFTAVLIRYSTIYNEVALVCSTITHQSTQDIFTTYKASSKDDRATFLNNEPCAICCK